ncbi:MAG: T9SS type A sorting domain-containing protein [Bacteroidales bacterium]
MIRLNLSIVFILFFSYGIYSQEVIIPLKGNPEAKEYYQNKLSPKKAATADTLELPFIDDFSDSRVEPKDELWSDNHAYINNKYPINQVTAGVATMDAYTAEGALYPNARSTPKIADYLTSHPLNLEYPETDNIYLSFFYQSTGMGEMPETQDSLCLEFLDVENQVWDRVWAIGGGYKMITFSRVIVPVNEEKYLKKGFQFRFLNYTSQSANNDYPDQFSNVDHWHLDYIYLDRNRSANDTILRDVTFTKPLTSFLKDYESIPWTHLEAAYFTQRKATIDVEISNLDTAIRNVTKALEIIDMDDNFRYRPTPTANDVLPGEIFDFSYVYDYPFNFGSGDSARFLLKTYLRTDAFDYKPNDTLEYIQVLKNYYAYDDGSAEAGYGLRGQGTQNASVAVKFNSFVPDSLRAVDMYFNQVVDSINLNYYFYLEVWDDNNGRPGNLIHSQIGERPAYSQEINQLIRYELDSTILVDGTFYVGWTKTVDKISNIGLDLNRDNSINNFYTLGVGWQQSSIPGSIMIRPVLSRKPLHLKDNNYYQVDRDRIKIYPNPASSWIRMEFTSERNGYMDVKMYDLSGRLVLNDYIELQEKINISELKEGIYLLRISDNHGEKVYSEKIIIQR